MQHVLGLTSSEEAKELVCGQAMHEALAWWACGKNAVEAGAQFTRTYKPWAEEHNIPETDRLGFYPVKRVLQHWLTNHPLEKFPLVMDPAEVEVPISAELGTIRGRRVVVVALLDALAKARTGGRWSVDHKTGKYMGDDFKGWQDVSSQFTGQLWIMREWGKRLSGVYINGIHLRETPSSNKKCSNPSHGGVKYAECGLLHHEHTLFPTTRTDAELDAWAVTAQRAALKLIRLQERVESVEDVTRLPMEGRFLYGACRGCEWKNWCEQGRPKGAARTFTNRVWNPLEHAQQLVRAREAAVS
jgi:hypothetical protein